MKHMLSPGKVRRGLTLVSGKRSDGYTVSRDLT